MKKCLALLFALIFAISTASCAFAATRDAVIVGTTRYSDACLYNGIGESSGVAYNLSVTIYLSHVRDSQSQARDISLPKLYNGRAMVWQDSPRALRSLESQSASLPLAAFDLCRWRTSNSHGDTRVSKQMESAMGKGGSSIAVHNGRNPYVCSWDRRIKRQEHGRGSPIQDESDPEAV